MLYPAELPGRGRAQLAAPRQAHYSRKAMTRSRAISLCLVLLACGESHAETCAGASAPLDGRGSARERLEIQMPDGRVLRQAGLALFAQTPDGKARFENARRALQTRLDVASIEAPAPLPLEDRWGRITGHFQTADENLGAWLARSGLARVAPLAGDPCGRILLNAEAKARQAKLGLWADPYYSVLAAENPVAFTSRSGEFVLVEGRILRLGQTSARFYLDFGPARGVDLSVTISKQSAKAIAAAGLRIEALPGQRVRARGTLDHRPGPTIDVVSPFSIELIGR